jgi:hypothetical protein
VQADSGTDRIVQADSGIDRIVQADSGTDRTVQADSGIDRTVQADSGTDSDSENWRQSAQRMSFVYQCRCVEWWQASGGSARQSESDGLPE